MNFRPYKKKTFCLLASKCLALLVCLAPISAQACPDIDGLVDINCDRQLKIITFGDSITAGVGDETRLGYPGRLQLFLPNSTVFNVGISGERTPTGRARAPGIFATVENPDYIIILQGVNDFFLPSPNAGSTRNNLLSIVSSARATGAVALLGTLTGINRSFQVGWVNSVNQQIRPFTQLDFFGLGPGILSSDRLHPNGAGYQVMAEFVWFRLVDIGAALRPIDTDADGIYDFAEASFGANPNIPDTDGDGLLDGAEVFTHGSSPNALDSDGDGFSDAREVNEIGSNPGDPRPGAPVIERFELLPRT